MLHKKSRDKGEVRAGRTGFAALDISAGRRA